MKKLFLVPLLILVLLGVLNMDKGELFGGVGYYTNLYKINSSGSHTFESEVLGELKKLNKEPVEKSDYDSGKIITIENTDVRLHTKGDKGSYVLITTEQLSLFTEEVQDIFYQYEVTPAGRREGVVKPIRQQ